MSLLVASHDFYSSPGEKKPLFRHSFLLFSMKYLYSPLESSSNLKSFTLISLKSTSTVNGSFVFGSVTVIVYSEPNAVFLKNIRIACLSSSTISSIDNDLSNIFLK